MSEIRNEPTAAALAAVVTETRAALHAGDHALAEFLMTSFVLDAPERQLAELVPPEHLADALAAYRRVGQGTLRVALAIMIEEELATLPVVAWLADDPALVGALGLTRAPELEARAVAGVIGLEVEGERQPIEGTWVHVEGRWRCLGLARLLAPYPPTLDGLRDAARLGLMLASAERGDELAALARGWQLPSPAAWLDETFGHAPAELVAELATYGAELAGVFESLAQQGRDTVAVELLRNPFSGEVNGRQRAAMLGARRPLALGSVEVRGEAAGPLALASWVVEGGAWRFVGKLRELEPTAPPPVVLPAAAFGPGADGLAALLGGLVRMAALGQADAAVEGSVGRASFDDLTRGLLLADPDATFARLVEPDLARVLATGYRRVTGFADLFRNLARGAGVDVAVAAVIGPDDPEATSAQRALVLALREPLTLYSATHSSPGAEAIERTRSWAWLDGGWRFLGSTWGVFRPLDEHADRPPSPTWQRFVREHYRYPALVAPRFPETADGLVALWRALAEAHARGDHALRRHLVESLAVADPRAFAAAVFATPDRPYRGPTGTPVTLAGELARARANLENDVAELLEIPLATLALSAARIVADTCDAAPFPTTGPCAMRSPVALWALRLAAAATPDQPGTLLMPWAFHDGAWRLLGPRVHADSLAARHLLALLTGASPEE